jgi:hypothetical protein
MRDIKMEVGIVLQNDAPSYTLECYSIGSRGGLMSPWILKNSDF